MKKYFILSHFAVFTILAILFVIPIQTNAQVSVGGGGGGGCYIFSNDLTLGSVGNDVSALQSWLINSGYDISAISTGIASKGYFGSQTASALSSYQIRVGLPATGYFGIQTRNVINSGCTINIGTTTIATSTGNYVNLSIDSASPLTSTVQVSDTVNNQYLGLPLLVFDLSLSRGTATSSLQNLSVNINVGKGSGSVSAVYLYQGSTLLSSASDINGVAKFTNINGYVFSNVITPITVKADVTNIIGGIQLSASVGGVDIVSSQYKGGLSLGVAGVANGNWITVSSGALNTSGVQVSNTSTVIGGPIIGNYSGIITYPVTLAFNLTAGNQPIYLSTQIGGTGVMGGISGSVIFSSLAGPAPTNGVLNAKGVGSGDTANYILIAPGQTRSLAVTGTLDNRNCPSAYSCTLTSKVAAIQYGISPNNLISNSITSGLDNLQVIVNFGGATSTQPTISVLTPTGGQISQGSNMYISWNGGSYPVQVGVVKSTFSTDNTTDNTVVGWINTRANSNGNLTWDTKHIGPLDYLTSGVSWIIASGQYKIILVSADSGGNYCISLGCNYNLSNTFTINSQTVTQQPSITSIDPQTAPAGSMITVYGSGFNTTDRYNNGIKWDSQNQIGYPTITPSNTNSMTFNVPYLANGPHTITLYVFQNNDWVQGNSYPFNIGSTKQPPVISGGTFPTQLNVGQIGTWTVNASDPLNGSLSYSVNWGDNGVVCPVGYVCEKSAVIQSSSFTHSYANPGTYTVTFSVRNSSGLSAQTSTTVNVVSATSQQPSITVVSPNGWEQYVTGSDIYINYKSSNINGSTLIAYLYSPIRGNVRSSTNIIAQNSGTIYMSLGKGVVEQPGQYKITICSNIYTTGKDVCDSSDNYFTIISPTPTPTPTIYPSPSPAPYVSPSPTPTPTPATVIKTTVTSPTITPNPTPTPTIYPSPSPSPYSSPSSSPSPQASQSDNSTNTTSAWQGFLHFLGL